MRQILRSAGIVELRENSEIEMTLESHRAGWSSVGKCKIREWRHKYSESVTEGMTDTGRTELLAEL